MSHFTGPHFFFFPFLSFFFFFFLMVFGPQQSGHRLPGQHTHHYVLLPSCVSGLCLMNVLCVVYVCCLCMYNNFAYITLTSLNPLLPPTFSILPTNVSGEFLSIHFILWSTEINQEHLYDHWLVPLLWSLLASVDMTQVKAVISLSSRIRL